MITGTVGARITCHNRAHPGICGPHKHISKLIRKSQYSRSDSALTTCCRLIINQQDARWIMNNLWYCSEKGQACRDPHYREEWNWTDLDASGWSDNSQLNNDHGKIGRVSGHPVALSTIFSRYVIFRLLLFRPKQGCNARSIIPRARSTLSIEIRLSRDLDSGALISMFREWIASFGTWINRLLTASQGVGPSLSWWINSLWRYSSFNHHIQLAQKAIDQVISESISGEFNRETNKNPDTESLMRSRESLSESVVIKGRTVQCSSCNRIQSWSQSNSLC